MINFKFTFLENFSFYFPTGIAQSGKTERSILKIIRPKKYIAIRSVGILIKFKTTPTFAISLIFILWLPKITALGGVATGNMNANEAESVAGIIKKRGCTCIATAIEAVIGKTISAVAVFEVNSVNA